MAEANAPCVACLGFFDGVHRGHLQLLKTARKAADQEGLTVCVHTFDRAPGDKDFALTTLEERKKLLLAAGADQVWVSDFDERMRHMSGEEFFQKVVLGQLNARHVVCGDDHRFGYRGACGVKELRAMCEKAGVLLSVVPPVTLENGERISSTAVRRAIMNGDIALAERMLGRKMLALSGKTE
ncbi:MAG: adenylyltransferase/cytidyltransferase family protein [Clostridia bacterium]|nr:adenylyltransferase/cytidyltransferase family protein [Clostridia bacterium]